MNTSAAAPNPMPGAKFLSRPASTLMSPEGYSFAGET
jgi:hypothetical protein